MKAVPIAVTLLALAPVPAAAHEFWLSPSRYRAAAGDTVLVSACVGTGFRGETRPYAASRVVRFALQAGRRLDLTRAATNGDLVMARFVAADDGGALVAYESTFAAIELPADEFDRYLATAGLDGPRAARAKAVARAPGRERYARCPKACIAGRQPARLLQPAGLTFELVPLADPAAGPTVSVQALFRGKPLSGALVRAWSRPLAGPRPFDPATRDSVGPAGEARTDGRGIATLRVDRPGEWLMSAVHMIPSADREAADWESYWASLTFAREAR